MAPVRVPLSQRCRNIRAKQMRAHRLRITDVLTAQALERRKILLARLLARARPGLRVNDHLAAAGDVMFRHACQLGLEGIVSKRLDSRYVSGRTRDWLKMKNPDAPAVKRDSEEEWGR